MCVAWGFVARVGGMFHTVNKCVWDLPSSSKGVAAVCPYALAISLMILIHASSRWEMFSFFHLHPWEWTAWQTDTSAQESFPEREDSPRGFLFQVSFAAM